MSLVAPETRYGPFRHGGQHEFAGQSAILLEGRDRWGAAIELFFSAVDSMPLGFRVPEPAPGVAPVELVVADWRDQDGVRLPWAARFSQEQETFDYTFERVDVNGPSSDEAWSRPDGEDL